MQRRILAAVIAALLTLVGAVFLTVYIQNADKRAMANLEPVDVLVVMGPIAKGTAAAELGNLVAVKSLPRAAVATGAVASLDVIKGKVAATDLLPGEQVLGSRFVLKTQLSYETVPVPKGLQEISVTLDAVRVIGGVVRPGNLVGVIVTVIDPKTGIASTKLMLDKVLVTRIQGATPITPDAAPGSQDTAPAAAQQVLVTLALDTPESEKLVFAVERKNPIWLTLQTENTSLEGSKLVTTETVLR